MVLLNVEAPISMMTPVNADMLNLNEAKILKKKEYLEGIIKLLAQERINARAEVITGERPAEAIINFIKSNPTQLIVMATNGHAGLSKMIFGSTTENILHLVKKTPVFLIGSQEEK